MFSAMVRWNRAGSCGTTAMARRSDTLGHRRHVLAVDADMARLDVVEARWINLTKVDLPEPVGPTSATLARPVR